MSEYIVVAYQIIVAQEQEVEITVYFRDCVGNKKLYIINCLVELDSENSYKIE